jgi:hypothetical protein
VKFVAGGAHRIVRFVGVTCHSDLEVLATCLERHDLDCTQMALNAGLIGYQAPSNVRVYEKSFERDVLPVASAVMGMPKLEYIDEDLRIAKNFTPMPKSEME